MRSGSFFRGHYKKRLHTSGVSKSLPQIVLRRIARQKSKRRSRMEATIAQSLAFGKRIVWPYDDTRLAPAREEKVLAEIFRLRSRIYTEMGYQKEFPDPVPGYNFDAFDTHSAIFYTHQNGKVTGTCRIVFDTKGALPIDKNYSLDYLRGTNRRLAELSRFIIDANVSGLSPEFKLLIKGMYGIIAHNDIDLAVTVIAREHFRLYEKVGGFQSEALLPTYGTLMRPYIIATWDTTRISPFFKKVFLGWKQAVYRNGFGNPKTEHARLICGEVFC